jgi:DivIVA domain-containing protein
VPLTPSDVAAKQFRVAFRGYAIDEVDAFLEEVESELGRLLTGTAGLAQPAASVAPGATAGGEGQDAALRTLLLAQRTADEAVAEARAEAEQVRGAARAEAEAVLGAARSEAEQTLAASRAELAGLDARIAERTQAALGDLEDRRRRLEARIDELRAFEREYRTRLRAYLQGQLRELDSRSGPDDDGVGVPVGAGRTAVAGSARPSGDTTGAVASPGDD